MTDTPQRRPDSVPPDPTSMSGLELLRACSTLEQPPSSIVTTLELNVNYVRTVRTDGQKLIAEGRTVHVGRSTATAEARIHDRFGHLVAHGTTTCLIRRANDRPARRGAPEEEG
ncbi:PaaI family thioesterase [Saccharothrix coeruleofusca]|uniref:Thioesterase domain-containing protein n=1 Tax=Saccharothrix coeruleofusca TaxID=33919 RepID=A0A918APP4_9PSEU|nr:PaaI family thioesterase [Saccharothrix coeruleofusca]GGP65526.1 hypothetical protein GCM10010185_42920 [Saccharothrix coeruleofusca]